MRSSITFRDNERTPLFRLKLPVNVFGISLFAGMAAGPNSGDLALQLGSRSEVGPSWRVRFRPNEEAPPSLIVKAGVGPWGSVVNGLLSMCAEFDIGRGGVTSFKIRAKPRFGDFSIGHGPIHYRHVSTRGAISGNGLLMSSSSSGRIRGGSRSLTVGRDIGGADDVGMECGDIPRESEKAVGSVPASRGTVSLGGGASKLGGDNGGDDERFSASFSASGDLLPSMGAPKEGGGIGGGPQRSSGSRSGVLLPNGMGSSYDDVNDYAGEGATTAPITPLIRSSSAGAADDEARAASVFGAAGAVSKGSARLLANGPLLRRHDDDPRKREEEQVIGELGLFGGGGIANLRSHRGSKAGLTSSSAPLQGQKRERENWNWGDWFVNVHSQLPVGKWAIANFRWTVRLFPRDDGKDDEDASSDLLLDRGRNWLPGPLGRLKRRPSLSLEKVSFESFYEDRVPVEGGVLLGLGGAGRASAQGGVAAGDFGGKGRHQTMLGAAGSRKGGRSGSTVTVNIPLGPGPPGEGEMMEPGAGMAPAGAPLGGRGVSRGVPTCGEQVQYLWSENAKLRKAMEDLRSEFHRLASSAGPGAGGAGSRRKPGGGEGERSDAFGSGGDGGGYGGQAGGGAGGQNGTANGRGGRGGGRDDRGTKDGRSGGVSEMGIPLPSDISEELKRAIMNAKNQ
ncbi:hypothetical protein CBR_g58399 [Chara braunii]|uniref:Uncharacterized protein n=1 Tax=Chara braunii TaxID=69332 RepID=A0A388MER3_CHABU|nr:hypothetical protein CBR_g58399 [Chara braunii]|eukprot:GBG93044.1 hypothetical protein CBR_g58399 [Chara braunii]